MFALLAGSPGNSRGPLERREEDRPGWVRVGPSLLGSLQPQKPLPVPFKSSRMITQCFASFITFLNHKQVRAKGITFCFSVAYKLIMPVSSVWVELWLFRTKQWETHRPENLKYNNQERICMDLRMKGEQGRVKRERVHLQINKDKGWKEATLRHISLVSFSLKQAAKNAFNLAIP